MTRSGARELALHVILDMDYTHDSCEDILAARLDKSYFNSLEEDNDIYTDLPSKKQEQYIRTAATAVEQNMELISSYIDKYSIGWKISRISRITKAILELAVCEILYIEDVPAGVAINEAVNLTKKYDSNESASYVNGVLGAFVRGEAKE